MVSFTVTYDKDVIEELQKAIADAPTTMNIYTTRTIRKTVDDYIVRNLVNVRVPKPTYPMQFKTPKQRRYVFWKLRKDDNLPYKRTGDFQRAWKTTSVNDKTSSILTVSNDSGITEYVSGSSVDRQPMFPQWYHYEDVLLKAEEMATDLAIDAWFGILDQGVFK